MKNIMKCIRTKQIHEYNSNIIYTQYKQHKANTKKNTHTHPTLPPHTSRNDLTMLMKQFILCIQRHTIIQYKTL